MSRGNCWEVTNCGREPDGINTKRLGVCEAAVADQLEGCNHGKNGGRTCWAIAGTFCKGKVQGSYAKKIKDCLKCDFYQLVKREEGKDYLDSAKILRRLRV
jgi:hypothetical protein